MQSLRVSVSATFADLGPWPLMIDLPLGVQAPGLALRRAFLRRGVRSDGPDRRARHRSPASTGAVDPGSVADRVLDPASAWASRPETRPPPTRRRLPPATATGSSRVWP